MFILQYIIQTSTNTEKSTDLETKFTSPSSKASVLPENRINIDEKDLYEHATEKQNNQSERAFIYINQKYKKPVRNKIFKVATIEKTEIAHNYDTKHKPIATTITPKPGPSFFQVGYGNSYFQGYEFSDKEKQDVQSYFVGPLSDTPGCDHKKQYTDNEIVKTQAQASHRADERRDYFELLKPPILRPVNRVNSKVNYNGNLQNEFAILASSSKPNKDYFLKKYNSKNNYLPKSKKVEERPNDLRKKYGFERPYVQPLFRKKEVLQRAEDINLDGGFVGDDDSHRLYESNQEEDKLLDKYLKDTLEEQVASNDKASNNQIDCSYRDCILQTSKQYSHNGLLLKPECKCGRRLNIKLADPFIVKDRSLREQGHHNETVPKSSELTYYEELLNDDTNNNKIDDDVVRPPSRYNGTSHH